MLLLVPADVLRPRRVDDHFAAEADAARAAGHQVSLVDHDAPTQGRAEQVERVRGPAVYRGWMLSSDRYSEFAAALAVGGTHLRTTPDQYRQGHELPGWYTALAAFTPTSAWTAGTDRSAFDAARDQLGAGPAVLRDYTKSMKHYWHEGAYIRTWPTDLPPGRSPSACPNCATTTRSADSCCAASNSSPAPRSAPGGSTVPAG